MRQSLNAYIGGGIAAAEGYANLMGNTGRRNRRATSPTSSRSSGS